MDLEKLKAEYPALYQAVIAEGTKIGIEKGVTQERDRVGAHLIMGEASGAMDVAIKAAKEGTEMTATLNAEYMAAGMNKKTADATQEDSDDSDAGDGAKPPKGDDGDDMGAEVVSIMEAKLGIKAEA